MCPVFDDFKMQMDASGPANAASAALFGNNLTLLYKVTSLHIKLRNVAITRFKPIAVVDYNRVAVAVGLVT